MILKNTFISAKENEMDIEPKFSEKMNQSESVGKRNNLMKILIMKLWNHLKSHLKLIIFLYIIDKAIITHQNKFEQFKIYEDIFGFLFSIKKLKSLDCVFLKEKCLNHEKYLKHDNL